MCGPDVVVAKGEVDAIGPGEASLHVALVLDDPGEVDELPQGAGVGGGELRGREIGGADGDLMGAAVVGLVALGQAVAGVGLEDEVVGAGEGGGRYPNGERSGIAVAHVEPVTTRVRGQDGIRGL